MPNDLHVLPRLVRAGRWIVNPLFLITSEAVDPTDQPDASSSDEFEITVFPGRSFRLTGTDASQWREGIAPLAPEPPSRRNVAVGSKVVIGRPGGRKERKPRR